MTSISSYVAVAVPSFCIALPNLEYPIFLPPPLATVALAECGEQGEREEDGSGTPAVGWKVVDGVGLPGNGPPSLLPGLSFPPSFRCRARAFISHVVAATRPNPAKPSQLLLQLSHPVQMQSTERKQTRKRVQNQNAEILCECSEIQPVMSCPVSVSDR